MYIKFEFYIIFHVKKYDSSPFLYNVLLCTFLVASSGELSSNSRPHPRSIDSGTGALQPVSNRTRSLWSLVFEEAPTL